MRQKLSARINAALLLVLCVLLIAPGARANKKKDLLKKAQAAEQAGDSAGALAAYCELSQDDPKNQTARAKCTELTQGSEQASQKDTGMMWAGEQALAQNRFDEAIQDFKAVVGKQYHDQIEHYLNVVIPEAQQKFAAEQQRLAAEAKNSQLFQQGMAAYKRNEFEKAKPLLSAVTGDNTANARNLLQQIDDYTQAVNEGARLESAGSYAQAIERYRRALKIKGDGPGNLRQKIAGANEKLKPPSGIQAQPQQASDQPLIDGIAAFYAGNYQQAEEKLSTYSGTGSRKALALFYLGASTLSRYFLAGADDKAKDLYTQAMEKFREARQAAAGFIPPQQVVSPRILAVFNQSGG